MKEGEDGLIDITDNVSKLVKANPQKYFKEEPEREQSVSINNMPIETATELRDQVKMNLLCKDRRTATELLAQWFQKHNHIHTTRDDTNTEVWIYLDGIYVPHGKTYIKEFCRGILREAYTTHLANEVVGKVETDTFIESDAFFNSQELNLIPVKNGLLNIFTRELSEFTPKKVFFNKLPVEYNKNSICPKIEKFLGDVLKHQQDVDIITELGGFCLLKEYKFEKAFMFVGYGRNGKDKTLELIKRTLGPENCVSVPIASLDPSSFNISELFGKMVNLAGEVSSKSLKDTSMFKALTGRTLVTAHRKFLSDITFVNYAKFIFACNELPFVYDSSRGFWDRWVLLEFPYTFVPEKEYNSLKDKTMYRIRDEEIIKKITTDDEKSGLLNKFLDGLDRLLKNKEFSRTLGSSEIKDLWIRKANSCIAFCLDYIEEDEESKVSKKDFRRLYVHYCKAHKITLKSDVVIKRTLQENYGVDEEQVTMFGVTDRYWVGIKLKGSPQEIEVELKAKSKNHGKLQESSLNDKNETKNQEKSGLTPILALRQNSQFYIGVKKGVICDLPNDYDKNVSLLPKNKVPQEIEVSEKKPPKIKQIGWLDLMIPDNEEVSLQDLYNAGVTTKQIEAQKQAGSIYECKPGFVRKL